MRSLETASCLGKDRRPIPRVAVVRCPLYEAGPLAQAVRRSLDLLGGLDSLLAPGMNVFVKINHLSPQASPERAICTHPLFAREVLRLLLDRGIFPTVGDDVNFGPGDEFLTTGFRSVCKGLGVPLVNLRERGFVKVSLDGTILKSVFIARPVLEADAVINLPKLKTHSFTAFTGAVKNMYGIIPSGLRLEYHRRFPRNDVFSQMLVDVFSAAPPSLNIMDAVVAMEGEGPSSGIPRRLGLVIAGRDGVAVDAAASRIVGTDPFQVFTTSFAAARGIGVGDLERIDIRGERIRSVEARDFRPSAIATGIFRRRLPSFLYATVSGQLVLTPEIVPQKCQACLECIRICPARTIREVKGKAWIDKSECIHCLCCHEVCIHRSIRLRQRPVGRLVRGAERLFKKAKTLVGKI
ncbi:MAG: DUF362 domain-containing protein [Candidatus Aminicenantes bacterium]|nr:DUF362 domain-containing protein [Candidatus Aminicenantes bacterium]